MNIQHVESLNDVVAQITRIRVRETVPDSIIDRADDIEIIDLTPDDLIQRLKEGKVYVPKTAERALEHYFSPGNLTALRELALRRTAQRVDEQLLTHMQAHAIAGPWAAGERVLVCVNERSGSGRPRALRQAPGRSPARALGGALRRDARVAAAHRGGAGPHRRHPAPRRAARRRGRHPPGGATDRGRRDRAMRRRTTSPTSSSASRHARAGSRCCTGSVTHELIRRAGDISVHVIAGEEIDGEPGRKRTVDDARRHEPLDLVPMSSALLTLLAALGVGLVLVQQFLDVANVALVFLTAVLAIAVSFGLLPALYRRRRSMLAFNFFFLPPLYTFTIADPENVVALFFFPSSR